jgi:hypothetical protein
MDLNEGLEIELNPAALNVYGRTRLVWKRRTVSCVNFFLAVLDVSRLENNKLPRCPVVQLRQEP